MVLTTTSTHNSKSFILYNYFNGASTSPFAVCSVNDKSATKKLNDHKMFTASEVFISSSDAFVAVAVVTV